MLHYWLFWEFAAVALAGFVAGYVCADRRPKDMSAIIRAAASSVPPPKEQKTSGKNWWPKRPEMPDASWYD